MKRGGGGAASSLRLGANIMSELAVNGRCRIAHLPEGDPRQVVLFRQCDFLTDALAIFPPVNVAAHMGRHLLVARAPYPFRFDSGSQSIVGYGGRMGTTGRPTVTVEGNAEIDFRTGMMI